MLTSRRWQEREGKERKVSQVSHCLTVSLSHKMNNKCNKKDNILIYNNLYENTISRWENGKMGKWENGKNVEQQYRKPTDAGKRVLKRQKPMVYGLQNTHIGMKTHRVIIEEQRKVTVKKQLVADDKYTAFFCHFSSLHTNILSKPTFSITLHLFSPTCSNTPERQHLSILAFWQTDKARETRIKTNDVIGNI